MVVLECQLSALFIITLSNLNNSSKNNIKSPYYYMLINPYAYIFFTCDLNEVAFTCLPQITGMREKVFQGTGDRAISDSMVGFRSPYLLVAHDVQFDALRNSGFLYDTSITNIETFTGRPPLWPFTLDYIMPRYVFLCYISSMRPMRLLLSMFQC